MQEWFKPLNKIGIYFPILLFFISFTYALDNCKGILPVSDSPCLLLLPYSGDCNSLSVTIYEKNLSIYTSSMYQYSPIMCNATFNLTTIGTYNGEYSTGDTFQIIVTSGNTRFYIYICLFAIIIFFLIAGYYFQQEFMLYMVGFLSPIMALDIYFNGFPNVSNVFLTNSVSIILSGLGMYYLVLPILIFIEEKLK